MIINIRGTSGSGKSTLVRNVTALYQARFPVKVVGRKQPIGYIHQCGTGKSLAVVGHYETDCGGCDTIANMDEIYDKVREAHAAGMDVLYEGLLISADANRVIALHTDGLPVRVIALNTPLDVCLASVNHRRRNTAMIKGKEYKGDVNPKNTTSKFAGVKSSLKRIEAAGIPNSWESRESALALIRTEFNL
jgi:thymidylate kinase